MTQNVGIVLPVTGSRKPGPYVRGLTVTWVSATTLSLGAGGCTDSTDAISMVVPASIVLNSAIVGAGGMDKGVLANNTFYYIYVIASSAALTIPIVSAVISLSATAPSLPTGYDAFRLVGIVLTDGSAELLKTRITGNGCDRLLTYDENIQITLPASGSFPTSYTALSLATAVAPIEEVSNVIILGSIRPETVANRLWLSTGGTYDNAIVAGARTGSYDYADMRCQALLASGIPTIYYKLDSASEIGVTIHVKTFSFNI